MIYLQKGDDSTTATSSNNQKSNVNATPQKKTGKRRRRNRKKKKKGGVTKPSGMLNEDGSNVERTIAGDSNNAQSGTVGQKKKEKGETDAALGTISETRRNVDSGGNNMKEAGDQESGMSSSAAGEASSTANRTRKDATLKYEKLFGFKEKGHVSGYTDSGSAANDKQKERAHPPAETELLTNTDARIRCTEDDSQFGTWKHAGRNTSKLGESSDVNNDVKTKQGKANMSSPEHKEPTSCHRKTADSFRDERLFTFSGKRNKVHSGGVDLNDEMDANPAVHNSKKKGAVYHPTDKRFATNRDTAKETKERDFFRYDRLFNFSTQKQNAPENAGNKATTSKTEEKDFFRHDRLFNFSTQKQNDPENAGNKTTTNKTEDKDFFRYDRLFSFSTGKQNAPDNTDDTSISSDDSYECELVDESETVNDDYAAFPGFYGGMLFILISF